MTSVAPSSFRAVTESPVVVALDYNNRDNALAFVDRIDPRDCRLKIGKEMFTLFGPQIVRDMQQRGFDVFLDLKFHDIPNTVAKAVAASAELGVWMVNVHASGGERMMRAAKEALLPFIDACVEALGVLGVTAPRIAVAGLNPHSGEHGLFGTEEVEHVIPAVAEARAKGCDIMGPIGADSVFYQALNGRYDAVLSLYHDQGHIATKMVDFERTISITCGMPILRTSVDHGTALDIAGKGIASPVSMIEAIRLAVEYAPHFKKHS